MEWLSERLALPRFITIARENDPELVLCLTQIVVYPL
jgi:hypothetical protein